MKEIRDNARKLMKGYCRVCPVCDGKACAGEVPGMGGIGSGAAFMNNVTALRAITLNMKVLHDAGTPDTSTDILGTDLSMPVMAAPIGGVSFNMGGGITEEAYIDAVLEGCRDMGVIGCTGDGVPPFIMDAAVKSIGRLDGHGIPFIKPWEGDELEEKIGRMKEAGSRIIGMDVDAAGLVTLRKMGRPVSPKTPDMLASIAEKIHAWGGKFVIKGIMDPREAAAASDIGVDAVIVSNHGGRVLDYTPATASVLPAIADAVNHKIPLLADSGVRSGFDVLKMLALGADCVLIGRPFSVAAVGGLKDGVIRYLEAVKGELAQAMVLTGCRDIKSVDRTVCRIPDK